MNISVLSVLIITIAVGSCSVRAGDLWCQVYDKSRKSLQQYCRNYNAALPEMCADPTGEIGPDDVLHLKIGGCGPDNFVGNAIKTYDRIRTLDISHSAYTSLDWLDLRLPYLEHFNASHNEITAIPPWLFKNARRIDSTDFSNNKLAAIHRDAFQAAKRLNAISVANNQLHENERDAFGVVRRLRHLDLSGNRYEDIPILWKNKHLTELHLEENPIKSFSCRYIDAMNRGEDDYGKSDGLSVYLSWQNITSFHGDADCIARKMRIMRDGPVQGVLIAANGQHELHCGGGQTFQMLRNFTAGKQSFENITDILPCFGAALDTLNLSDNIVQGLNETSLKTFVYLKNIGLRNTNLTAFDFNWFGHQEEISELDISKNELKQLMNFALLASRPWEKLRILNVAENKIENMPDILHNLKPALRKLNVNGNVIGELNATTLDRFTALETINLAHTNLSIANGTNPFDRLFRLSSIDVSNNDVVDLDEFASTLKESNEFRAANARLRNASSVIENLGPLTKLLDLSGNFIGKLDPLLFEAFPYLKHLYLSNANITEFDSTTLLNQYNLKTLDLSRNKLNSIDLGTMSSKLEVINLDGNNLTQIDNLKRSYFPRLKSLRISGNRFDCDYLVAKMKRDWKEIPFADNPYDQQHDGNCFSKYTINAVVIGMVLAVGATAAIVSVFGPFVAGWLKCSK